MTRNNPIQSTQKDEPNFNSNSLHEYHLAKRGPKGVPRTVMASEIGSSNEKSTGHTYANTQHVSFQYFDQRASNAPFGYEHFVSLPPHYESEPSRAWPLILFLHGAGESQCDVNESFLSIRHGIPKVILCYDSLKKDSGKGHSSISIPRSERLNKNKQTKQGDNSGVPVPEEVCKLLAENFITITPSLNMAHGYGWNARILSALLDEVVDRYRIDVDRVHVTGFSMGGYGTWALGLQTPNRFASLVPVCGGGDALRASHIKHIPQWIHHGDLDDIIPVKASIQMVDALQAAGAPEIKFTRYPTLMHDSWTEAYNNPDLYRWMLATLRTVEGEEQVVPEDNKVTLPI